MERFRGLKINGAGIDELSGIQEKTFNKLIEKAGSWQHSPGCPIKTMATSNPTSNWVKQKFYHPWKNGCLPESWAYVPAKITDNSHLSTDYVENLKNLPEFEYKVFVNGDWEYDADDFKLVSYSKIMDSPFNTFVEKGVKYIIADIARFGLDTTVIMV